MMAQFDDTILADSSTYQNDDLVLAKSVKSVIVNGQVYTAKKGDFTFDTITGTITFISISLFSTDTITVMFKK